MGALLTRKDTIVVASVSCIYGLGSPEDYEGMMVPLHVGKQMTREELLTALVNMLYERNDFDFGRGKFRVRGDIVEVQAMSSNAVRGFAVEDTASISFRFASGVLASFLVSDASASARSWEQTSQENKAYASYDDEDCYVIAGTMGSLSVPTMRLKTYATSEDRSWFKPFQCSTVDLIREDPLRLQMDHFLQVIQGQAKPLVSARDGLQNLWVVEAITQATQTQKAVRLALH
jgi:predicted dehydrogenase